MGALCVWMVARQHPIGPVDLLRVFSMNVAVSLVLAFFAWIGILRSLTQRRAELVRRRAEDPRDTHVR